jgi:hypothetical protein
MPVTVSGIPALSACYLQPQVAAARAAAAGVLYSRGAPDAAAGRRRAAGQRGGAGTGTAAGGGRARWPQLRTVTGGVQLQMLACSRVSQNALGVDLMAFW